MGETFRVLVTGSRIWQDAQFIYTRLDELAMDACESGVKTFIVVHGDNPKGADRFAKDWTMFPLRTDALGMRVIGEPHAAQWKVHGRHAGLLRNQEMVDSGADLCLAFVKRSPVKSRGTLDCMRRAQGAGIPVWRYEE